MYEIIHHIEKLMEQGKTEEARQELAKLVRSDDFMQATAAPAYLTLMTTYLSLLTGSRAEYHQALDIGIALLKSVNAREQELKDGIDLARVHREIGELQAKQS